MAAAVAAGSVDAGVAAGAAAGAAAVVTLGSNCYCWSNLRRQRSFDCCCCWPRPA